MNFIFFILQRCFQKLVLESHKMYHKWTNFLHGLIFTNVKKYYNKGKYRGGCKNSATSKVEPFLDKRSWIKDVNYCHKELRLRCCSKSRSTFEIFLFLNFLLLDIPVHISFYKTRINWFCVIERVRIYFQPSGFAFFIRKTVHTDFLFLPFQFY